MRYGQNTVRCISCLVLSSAFISASVHAQPLRVDARKDFDTALALFDEAQLLQGDLPDRALQLFRSAAQRFESVVAGGIVNGRLEYNLGNCYLQAGDMGRAILHYRRAERMIPGDELLAANLAEARRRCLTHIPRARSSAFLRSVFFWHHQTSYGGRIRTALIAFAMIWVCLILRVFLRHRGVALASVLFAVVAASSGISAATTRWSDRNAPNGVITAMDVIVYKGPGGGYQRQFEQPLQPGVEFVVREQRGDYRKIELPDGKSGWVEAGAVEMIPPPQL